jgi:hypothetical protein
MMDEQQARYADLIESSARILAFDGLIDAARPVLASALTSEAVDLRNGWAEFFPNDEAGAAMSQIRTAAARMVDIGRSIQSSCLLPLVCNTHETIA